MPRKEIYTAPEVAELLRVDLRTVYRWIQAGKLKAVKIGGSWRITANTIKEIRRRGLDD